MNRLIIWRRTQVLVKNWSRFGCDVYWFVSRCKHRCLKFNVPWLQTFARAVLPTEVGSVRVFFIVRSFVHQVALFYTSIVKLKTDVYNHKFLCRFYGERYFLNDLEVCSEQFAVLKLVAALLNVCTLGDITVRKPETTFCCEFATKRFF